MPVIDKFVYKSTIVKYENAVFEMSNNPTILSPLKSTPVMLHVPKPYNLTVFVELSVYVCETLVPVTIVLSPKSHLYKPDVAVITGSNVVEFGEFVWNCANNTYGSGTIVVVVVVTAQLFTLNVNVAVLLKLLLLFVLTWNCTVSLYAELNALV